MMVTMLIVGLVIGGALGFYSGRWLAERGRAAFEARAAWNGRKRYRGTRPF